MSVVPFYYDLSCDVRDNNILPKKELHRSFQVGYSSLFVGRIYRRLHTHVILIGVA